MIITNKQIREALRFCRVIYGHQEIHVQLIAKQLGCLAIEVARWLENNAVLATTRFVRPSDPSPFLGLGAEYPGTYVEDIVHLPYLTTDSVIAVGESGGTIAATLVDDKFTADGVTTVTNWAVDVGETGLTLGSVARTSDTVATLTFTGTAKAGVITIKPKAVILDECEHDGDILVLNVEVAVAE